MVPESDPDAGVVGRFVVSNSDYDYAVIEFDPAKVTPVNTIGQVTITDIGKPAQFPAVACKQGRTTGHTCGVVYGDVLQSQETWTQLCVIEGDSGSPVVVGTTLVAMVNAYLGVACLGPELGTNMTAIIDNITRQVASGRDSDPSDAPLSPASPPRAGPAIGSGTWHFDGYPAVRRRSPPGSHLTADV